MTNPKIVTGIESTEQIQLVQKMSQVSVDLSLVASQTCLLSAVKLCVSISGFQDNQVYLTLGIDAGHWTRIMKGDAHFPLNKLNDLMDYCGNEAPLMWLNNSRGYDQPKKLESETERALREAQEQFAKSEAENALLRGLLKG